ncbi:MULTISPECIES: hypothetical protein [Actinomycetes]|uniref:Uncharacterized protein n=2 Tax=Actinomycetes TaxID=1760 RepID=A0ABP6LW53_9MICC
MPATPVEEPETRLGPAATSAGAARPAESGTPTQPETRGIELIDESSRRGRPGAL